MLSRIAENLYWIGRYVERISNTVSLLEATGLVAVEGARLKTVPADLWCKLLEGNQELEFFQKTGEPINERTVHDFLIFSAENPSSLSTCLWNVRENMRSARNRLSSMLWLIVNEFYLFLKPLNVEHILALDRGLVFQKMREFCLAFSGACDHTILQDESWYFLRLGRSLERSIQTAHLLDFHAKTLLENTDLKGTAVDIHQWQILLRCVDGLEAYTQAYTNRIVPTNVVAFLLQEEKFPRSILFNVRRMEDILRAIPQNQNSTPFWLLKQDITSLKAELFSHSAEEVFGDKGRSLGGYLQNILTCLLRSNGLIYQSYFSLPSTKEDGYASSRSVES